MENGRPTTSTNTMYKDVFNKHRRKPDNPLYIGDLDEMVDFSSADPPQRHENIIDLSKRRRLRSNNDDSISSFQYQGPIYGLRSHPGFAYMPSALSPSLQNDLVYKAVTEFCEPPHGTNIDLVPLKEGVEDLNLKEESMWELWKRENIYEYVEDNILTVGGNSNPYPNLDDDCTQFRKEEKIKIKCSSKQKDRGKSRNNNNNNNNNKEKKKYYKTFEKLSWATLGYRFDWTARAYREKNKSAMPKVLDQLGKFFAKLGEETNCNVVDYSPDTYSDVNSNSIDTSSYSFTASAAIVNYYSLKSSMGGHRDDSELDVTKPVVSFSLGLPAVFLIGGKTRDEGPVVPLLLRPGDVMLLGGDSRLNFHGVTRILPHGTELPTVGRCIGGKRVSDFQIQSWSFICGDGYRDGVIAEAPHSDRLAIERFLLKHRVNANVRQVLPDGVKRIPGDTDHSE